MTKLSQESWEDVYTAYLETRTEPSTWPTEGLITSFHYMMYLKPQDVFESPEED